MKSNVSYDKDQRKRAIDDRKGLFTIDLISASKTPGKLGGRITMQGPADEEERKLVYDFIIALSEHRTKHEKGGSTNV